MQRHIVARGVWHRVKHQHVDVALRGDDVVHTAKARVIRPRIVANDPARGRHQVVLQRTHRISLSTLCTLERHAHGLSGATRAVAVAAHREPGAQCIDQRTGRALRGDGALRRLHELVSALELRQRAAKRKLRARRGRVLYVLGRVYDKEALLKELLQQNLVRLLVLGRRHQRPLRRRWVVRLADDERLRRLRGEAVVHCLRISGALNRTEHTTAKHSGWTAAINVLERTRNVDKDRRETCRALRRRLKHSDALDALTHETHEAGRQEGADQVQRNNAEVALGQRRAARAEHNDGFGGVLGAVRRVWRDRAVQELAHSLKCRINDCFSHWRRRDLLGQDRSVQLAISDRVRRASIVKVHDGRVRVRGNAVSNQRMRLCLGGPGRVQH